MSKDDALSELRKLQRDVSDCAGAVEREESREALSILDEIERKIRKIINYVAEIREVDD